MDGITAKKNSFYEIFTYCYALIINAHPISRFMCLEPALPTNECKSRIRSMRYRAIVRAIADKGSVASDHFHTVRQDDRK